MIPNIYVALLMLSYLRLEINSTQHSMLANTDTKVIFIHIFDTKWYPTSILALFVYIFCLLVFPDFIMIWFFNNLILLLKYVMFEIFPVLVRDKFYQEFINFGNPKIIFLVYIFMFNLSQEINFSIIVCFVLTIYFWIRKCLN